MLGKFGKNLGRRLQLKSALGSAVTENLAKIIVLISFSVGGRIKLISEIVQNSGN